MRFLDGEATTKEIVRLTEFSRQVRMAVAFWGDGAVEGLGLEGKGTSASVVCNLRSGGTNPHEIQKLIDQDIPVRQCHTLHGKVYLFDEQVIVGSSNASANGLALQGKELAGWREANILTADRSIYEAAERWMDELDTRPIDQPDLDAAKVEFDKRRAAAAIMMPPKTSLVDALRTRPETFKDRQIYVCVYLERFDEEDRRRVARERERREGDKAIDALGWEVPTDAKLVCFYINKRNAVLFEGFWERPATEWKSAGSSPLYFMRKLRDLNGLSSDGLPHDWAEALLAFSDAEISPHKSVADHVELGEFYDRYLSRTEPRTKILNVLDKIGRVKSVGGGRFELGFWSRPDRGCDLIRVFQSDGGRSVRGGRILEVRQEMRRGRKAKVVVFADVRSQHGKPAPKFRRNGCAATFE